MFAKITLNNGLIAYLNTDLITEAKDFGSHVTIWWMNGTTTLYYEAEADQVRALIESKTYTIGK